VHTVLHYAHPPTLFPHLFHTPTSTKRLGRTCSVLLFYDFVEEEKRHFCLFKIAMQGVSLWHFHVCMYYNLNWFISSIFLLSPLVPFLTWFQQV
jgi:hypothetical protein